MTVVQITVVVVFWAWAYEYNWWKVAGTMACLDVVTWVFGEIGFFLSRGTVDEFNWWRVGRAFKHFSKSPYVVIVASLSAFSVAMVVWYGLRLPAMQYDVYHVVRGVLMMQTGHLPPFGWDGQGVDYYPGNMDMLYAWRVLGTRNDALFANVQLYFGLAGCLAIYGISRNLIRASRETSAIVAMCLFSMTTVIHSSWLALADLGAAGMYWCAVGVASSKRLTAWDLALIALAGGWAVGAKSSLGYWVAGLAVFVIWRVWHEK